ncbi:uncharacterized protein LOC108029807 [Drosophila biarmipes]|uniref:uncharacterized protein LOC108029807 n=1 Tax=Drosophila biarmipes TaxID=125945 RepID=UPI0007E6E4A1|nr:uncharacterized protein LOC108029807 [Drosophila biarmipes]
MQRSVLLLGVFAILLCAVVALPTSLSKSEEDWLEHMQVDIENSGELQDLDDSSGGHVAKRSAKDSSSSEENKNGAKDKANSSGSSSEEKLAIGNAVHAEETTTVHSARKRREITTSRPNTDITLMVDQLSKILITLKYRICHGLEEGKTTSPARFLREKEEFCAEGEPRRRREAADKDQTKYQKPSEESEMDTQAEKELDEEMTRAEVEIQKILNSKDSTSIEDYAQGCEVMEVSSKEANEATYAE